MKYPYRRYAVLRSDGGTEVRTIYRPLVPVRIVGSSGTVEVLGLLDTGADTTILPWFLVQERGISVASDNRWRLRGVGNQVVSVSSGRVELQMGRGRSSLHWSAEVGFIQERTVAVLGHAGFLEHFRVVFDGLRHEVTLQPNTSLPR